MRCAANNVPEKHRDEIDEAVKTLLQDSAETRSIDLDFGASSEQVLCFSFAFSAGVSHLRTFEDKNRAVLTTNSDVDGILTAAAVCAPAQREPESSVGSWLEVWHMKDDGHVDARRSLFATLVFAFATPSGACVQLLWRVSRQHAAQSGKALSTR